MKSVFPISTINVQRKRKKPNPKEGKRREKTVFLFISHKFIIFLSLHWTDFSKENNNKNKLLTFIIRLRVSMKSIVFLKYLKSHNHHLQLQPLCDFPPLYFLFHNPIKMIFVFLWYFDLFILLQYHKRIIKIA